MARFLFVVPPLVGHVNPTVSLARELAARGHRVAWVGHPGTVRRLLPDGAELFELDDAVPQEMTERVSARASQTRGPERLKFLREEFFLPLARAMIPGVQAAVDALAPDALIVDQQTLAGAMVARLRGLPWATVATTSAGVIDPLAAWPKVREWQEQLFAELQRELGLPVVADAERSPHLFLALTIRELVGGDQWPAHYHFVGPSFGARHETAGFPWDALAPGRRVLVSLGTVNADLGERFYREVLEAFRDQPVQIVLVAPRALLGDDVPTNVLVRDFVPQLALLPRVDAVVSHGGHNTVVESLAHGRPLVLAPIKDDQPIVAQQVVDAGAGLRVKFGRVKAATLRETVLRVLDEPSFAQAAARIAASFERAGGAPRGAELLEGLL